MLAGQSIGGGLEPIAQDEVNRTAEQLLGFAGHFEKFVRRHTCRILQSRQQVDVAPSPLLPA